MSRDVSPYEFRVNFPHGFQGDKRFPRFASPSNFEGINMGTLYRFSCPNCAHAVEVSGGDDAGMVCLTTTVVCEECRQLYDVAIVKNPGSAYPKRIPIHCPKSGRHKVKRWRSPRPCPKCGTSMKKGEPTVLWD